jgi:hypothetical protein
VPGKILPDDELERLSTGPPHVAGSDLAAHFTLSLEDRRWVQAHRGAEERIGLAVQPCALGFLGFVPADLAAAPREVVALVARQVGVAQAAFDRYASGADGRTRRPTWPPSWPRQDGGRAGRASGTHCSSQTSRRSRRRSTTAAVLSSRRTG